MSSLATPVLVLALLAPRTCSPTAFSDAPRVLVFFSANDGVHGRELWKSDGTDAGTTMVKDIRPGGNGSDPALFAVIRGRAFFAANDGRHGLRMWASDGTSAGTRLIEGSPAPLPEPWSGGGGALARGSLYFTTHRQNKIWRTDGTAAGTVPLGIEGECLASARGVVFFVHNATSEVWRTNGTAAGTFMLQRLRHPSGLRACPSFTDVGGTMIYEGRDVRHGHEPWKSDGTVRGTTLLKDIVPGPDSSGPSMRGGTVDRAFFVTSSLILWTSDGTSAGTVRLHRFRRWVGVLGGHPVLATTLFFYASAVGLGAELWKSDGTHDGTGMVNDINPGHPSSSPLGAAALDGDLFFQADDGAHGSELWRTDGTETGTFMVKDVNAGIAGSAPDRLVSSAGLLLFAADDGLHGYELWKSDGTEAGTVMLKDINLGESSGSPLFVCASPSSDVCHMLR